MSNDALAISEISFPLKAVYEYSFDSNLSYVRNSATH